MSSDVLQKIRNKVNSFVGHRVQVSASRGRRKSVNKEGIIEKTHANVFIIKVEEDEPRRLAYSYADLLTDNVELIDKENETRIGII